MSSGKKLVVVVLALLATACDDDGKGRPAVVDAQFLEPFYPAPTEGDGAPIELGLDGAEAAVTPTVGIVRVALSERLNAETVQAVSTDEETGQVTDIVGKSGIARIVADGIGELPAAVTYWPQDTSLRVSLPVAYTDGVAELEPLPSGTPITVYVLIDAVEDPFGNHLAALLDDNGDVAEDDEGNQLAGIVIFDTEPLAVDDFVPPTGEDDPETLFVDEASEYYVVFNTHVAAADAAGLVSFVNLEDGTIIDATVEQAVIPGDGAELEDEPLPGTLIVTPLSPLTSEEEYVLRVEPALTDTYGVPLGTASAVFPFVSL